MGLTAGLVLLALGILLVALGRPRRGEDLRPFLRSPLAQVLYPSLCLVLLSLGAAFTLTNLL
jgi:hypothetical protein